MNAHLPLQGVEAGGPSACLIVFGPLRGGTTLLRLMLDGHPRLSCIGETDYVVDHLVPDPTDESGWRYDADAMDADRIYRDSGLTLRRDLPTRDAFHDLVGQIGRDGTIPVLMLHRRMSLAAAFLPDAHVLRFTRDPRDSARSAIGMGWAGDVYHGVVPWMGTEESWQTFEASDHDLAIHRLAFEDLVTEPEARLRDICDFLSIPYDDGLLAYPATTTYDAPDAGLAHQWKRKLEEHEVALVEGRVGPMLQTAGYAPSGVTPTAPTRLEQAKLAVGTRWWIWKRLVTRYGIALPVARGIGRRARLKPLERWGQRGIDARVGQYLK